MITSDLTTISWFSALEPDLQQSFTLTITLLEREKKTPSDFSDYSFVLFPMGKAYEGFLKKFLFDLDLITEEVYLGRHFRIGRALNPDISHSQRDEWWLYDNLESSCGSELTRKLWKAWIECRNHVFHYFPENRNELTLEQVEKKIDLLVEVFELAWKCTISDKS